MYIYVTSEAASLQQVLDLERTRFDLISVFILTGVMKMLWRASH